MRPHGQVLRAAWVGSDKLREVMLEGGFQPEKIEIISLQTMLSGEQMKPAWATKAVAGWDDANKNEFEKQFTVVLEGLKTTGTEVGLASSVAIAEK